jgi:ferrous iron transport protein B
VFAPLGFNWQICIALIPGLAAREVAVSSLATVYALSRHDDAGRAGAVAADRAGWSLATALSLLVWYIYAPMCIRRWRRSSARPIVEAGRNQRGLSVRHGLLASMVTYQVAVALGAG